MAWVHEDGTVIPICNMDGIGGGFDGVDRRPRRWAKMAGWSGGRPWRDVGAWKVVSMGIGLMEVGDGLWWFAKA